MAVQGLIRCPVGGQVASVLLLLTVIPACHLCAVDAAKAGTQRGTPSLRSI